MTATMHDRSPSGSAREGWAARVLVHEMWGTLAIVAMWVAVLFVGVFGSDIVPEDPLGDRAGADSGEQRDGHP